MKYDLSRFAYADAVVALYMYMQLYVRGGSKKGGGGVGAQEGGGKGCAPSRAKRGRSEYSSNLRWKKAQLLI